ncbi:MAG: PSD1 and planctomycete cytochrome C domain-containing protein [Planctomycetaceae bacterium]
MNKLAYICLALLPVNALAQDSSQQALDHFERKIRPLLIERCVSCHGSKKQESGIRLDRRAGVFDKQDFGTLVVPGNPKDSRLLQVVHYSEDDVQMPPSGKMAENEIRLLTDWIESGAAWPKDTNGDSAEPDAWKEHWAFQPIGRPKPPTVDGDAWSRNSVDKFVLSKLNEANLSPQQTADQRTQVRRIFFDITGLPPTYEQVQAFEKTPTNEAFARLADQQLQSPHFGERWARHWMDVARYSDTTGYVFTQDRNQGDAWKYREWLIDAFNNDMPIDEFLVHQIAVDRVLSKDAGDELSATGFLTLGRRFLNNKHDIIDDRIDVMTRGMMGLTVTCARCHDHKYDPIPAADYYSLYGVLASTNEVDRKKTSLRLVDAAKPFNPYIFKRGQAHNHGKRVPRQFLSALTSDRKPFKDGSGRLELAKAIANANNPLTARVFVNRVWSHLVGGYLVDTPSDFGVRSKPPTHPLLLDYLAGSLIDNGWSLKNLIREIVLSSTYRQRSDGPASETDPENRLLSRMNRKRLEFEAQRDALLAASGELDQTVGGESVDITKQPYPKRRTVYAFIDRQNLPGVFRAFDLASPDTHAPRRYQTTVPQQGLFQLNNPFVLEQATALAARTKDIADPEERIQNLFRLTYSREPSAYEVSESLAFIAANDQLTEIPGWQYGYGEFDAETNRVATFEKYPHFTGQAWQGGEKLPDAKLSWSLLNATGGHPGGKGHAAIRRWVAPHDGLLSIRGVLNHKQKEGDGVIGRIVSNRTGQLNNWTVAQRAQPISITNFEVRQGEIIDFVCESGPTLFFDGFDWSLRLSLDSEQLTSRYVAAKNFNGKSTEPLSPWAQYAQVLLMANEFIFID